MVVLVIMGILVGFAVLGLGGNGYHDQLKQESRRLEAKMRLAVENAVLEGRDLGIGFALGGYQFYELNDEQWEALGSDNMLKETKLEETLSLQLQLESVDIVMAKKLPEKPQVFILSSGENTPFQLQFEAEKSARVEPVAIAFDMLGRVVREDRP